MNKTVYNAFGLKIVSEIKLPELFQSENKIDDLDIEVKIKDLSKQWSKLNSLQEKVIIKKNLVMFQVPDAAIFSIQDGKTIIVDPIFGAEEDKIRLYILGTCMGAILMQRKIFPLHGSAIAINGKAYAFVGESGAGKSTLASAFLSKGYQLLSDDVIAVSFDEKNKPYILPSYPQQKLWLESLNEFGKDIMDYRPLFERETKYAVPVESQFCANRLPLAGVFELVKKENEQIVMSPIEKLERLKTLYSHTFRNSFIDGLGLMNWHFTFSVKIIKEINLYQLVRPISKFTAYELVSLIIETINKGEIR
ncbi:aldolase [Bacillus sp. AFS017336]|uniref:aldolase n=1 Tax=Bacillus sp. AFS017336 TaxID=2033489 RepID=UPI0035A178ED